MARFQVKFETKTRNGTPSGVQGTTVQADSVSEAKEKVKSQHASTPCKIISCVKTSD